VGDDDAVFRALADPTRRALLDRLRERNGQTLGELCGPLAMARQSATQHLGVLEAASLITTVRRGREKLHYLNPVPLWAIEERWIGKFERPNALRAVSAGWPAVCANLKSLLETGHVLRRAPWEMHADLRAAQMARSDPATAP
jgi:DNA-binding transcriptional ArsR family regulator